MSEMDEINRVTLNYLKNSSSFKAWVDWLFNPLHTPVMNMLSNPFDGMLREWQLRERQ